MLDEFMINVLTGTVAILATVTLAGRLAQTFSCSSHIYCSGLLLLRASVVLHACPVTVAGASSSGGRQGMRRGSLAQAGSALGPDQVQAEALGLPGSASANNQQTDP